jgi:putative transposase
VAALLAAYADQRDEQGHARVVLSGHHPKRDNCARDCAGAQRAESPGRSGDVAFGVGAAGCAQDGQPGCGDPVAVLEGISTGEMQPALEVLVGPEAKGLSASTVARLKQIWREENAIWRNRRLDVDQWVSIKVSAEDHVA